MTQKTTEPASNSTATALLVALGIGVIAGLLLAPKSGKETTAFLKGKAADAKARFNAKKDELKSDAKDKL